MKQIKKETKPTKNEIKVEPTPKLGRTILPTYKDRTPENVVDPKSKKIEILAKIKIAKKFALLIKMGFKTVEVRKLIKGYVEGYYMLVDVETGKDLFVIHLEPHALNPTWCRYVSGNCGYSYKGYAHIIDELTWKWVKKNYVKKKIDFVVYKISIPEVKDE